MKETAEENFVIDYFLVEWDNFLLSSNTNSERSYITFLEMVKSLLDTCKKRKPA